MKDRRDYFKGYNTGRKFDKALTLYCLVSFAFGMFVEYILVILTKG